MLGQRNPQPAAYSVQGLQGQLAVPRIWWPRDNKIVQVMLAEGHALLVDNLFQSICYGVEHFWGRAKTKWEHGVHIDLVLPLNCLQDSFLRVDWDEAIGRLDVYLAKRAPLPSLATISATASTEVYFREQRLASIPSFTLWPSG